MHCIKTPFRGPFSWPIGWFLLYCQAPVHCSNTSIPYMLHTPLLFLLLILPVLFLLLISIPGAAALTFPASAITFHAAGALSIPAPALTTSHNYCHLPLFLLLLLVFLLCPSYSWIPDCIIFDPALTTVLVFLLSQCAMRVCSHHFFSCFNYSHSQSYSVFLHVFFPCPFPKYRHVLSLFRWL